MLIGFRRSSRAMGCFAMRSWPPILGMERRLGMGGIKHRRLHELTLTSHLTCSRRLCSLLFLSALDHAVFASLRESSRIDLQRWARADRASGSQSSCCGRLRRGKPGGGPLPCPTPVPIISKTVPMWRDCKKSTGTPFKPIDGAAMESIAHQGRQTSRVSDRAGFPLAFGRADWRPVSAISQQVVNHLSASNHRPAVEIKPDWYY